MNTSSDIMNFETCMQVEKRGGSREDVNFNKITNRIKGLSKGLHVDCIRVTQKVIENIFDGVTTRQLDELAAQIAASLCLEHPDYADLAGRIAVSNHQKNTHASFYRTMKMLYDAQDNSGQHSPIVSKEFLDFVRKHKKELDEAIVWDRDFEYDFFGWRTLFQGYLMRLGTSGEVLERIQHMWMRVACGLHLGDLPAAIESYNFMSLKMFTHATPTLFNMGTPRPQGSSCYLVAMKGDSVQGIFSTLQECALISKYSGGIGLWSHDIRAKNSYIRGTNGRSNGIVPMLKTFNATARYIDQCFAPGTEILTTRGIAAIEQLQPGDNVIGQTGEAIPVKRILSHHHDGSAVQLKMSDGKSVICSPEHQILSSRQYNISSAPGAARYCNINALLVGDWLPLPQVTGGEDVDFLSEDDCQLIGLLCSCGSVSGNKAFLNITSQNESYQFVQDYLCTRGIMSEATPGGLTWLIDMRQIPITQEMLQEKQGLAGFLFGLPSSKTKAILQGLDGQRLTLSAQAAADALAARVNKRMDHSELLSKIRECSKLDNYLQVTAIQEVYYQGQVYDIELNSLDRDCGYVCTAGVAHSG